MMRAQYLGAGAGNWKGIDLSPGLEFDVPAHLEKMVAANPVFAVIKRKPGRPKREAKHDPA